MSQVDRILDKALNGGRLGLEEIVTLFESDEIEKMGAAADTIMKRFHPEPITTFVIGRNINYSNICDTYCRFCAFYRAPGSPEGYVLPNETIFRKIQETVEVGGTEILMQGGTHPDLPFSYYLDLLREIRTVPRHHDALVLAGRNPQDAAGIGRALARGSRAPAA